MRTIYTLVDSKTEGDIKECQHEHRTPEAAARCKRQIVARLRKAYGANHAVLAVKALAGTIPVPNKLFMDHSNVRFFRNLSNEEDRRYFGF